MAVESDTNDHYRCEGPVQKIETNLGTSNRKKMQKIGHTVMKDLRKQRGTLLLTKQETTAAKNEGPKRRGSIK